MTTHPGLALDAFGWDPRSVNPGSNKVKSWKCQAAGHVWQAAISNRTRRGDGCPVCSGRQVVSGENDLATLYADLASQAVDWDPSKSLRFANKRVSWKCKEGHTWEATVSSRIAGSGCPYCAGQKVIPGLNDLATLQPDLAMEADGWDPTSVMEFANVTRSWQCKLGHHWKAKVSQRTIGSGCPFCSGSKVLPGFNDLLTTFPDLAAEAFGWDPSTVSKGSISQKTWLCEAGHKFTATVGNRVHGRGCPKCAKYGFNPGKQGWLYLYEHELWGLLQIGITNVPDQRLAKHASRGWHFVDLRGPMAGDVCRAWEQAILGVMRASGVALGPEHIAGKFDGYSESWIKEDYPAQSLDQLMALVRDVEDKLKEVPNV